MASRPQLLKADGSPWTTEDLTRDVAGPSLMSVRSIISGHPAQGLNPSRLAALLLQAEQGDATSYLELAEEMEEKDLHYLSVLGTRKRAVAQLPIQVEAASDDPADVAAADLVRSWIDRDELQAELVDLLDAVGKGFSLTEVIWSTRGGRWLPERLEWRDPRWFEFDRIDGTTPLLRSSGDVRLEGMTSPNNSGAVPLPPYKFIYHRHQAKSGLPIRGGIARAASWHYMFKNFGIKDWVAFAEVYGMPLRVGKYANGESEENIRLLMRAVAQMGSDAAAVFPETMKMEFIDGKTGNADGALFKNLAEYFDHQLSKAVLGQTATTDAVTGGLGSGKEHNDVRGDIERADAAAVQATLNGSIVRWIVDLNLGPRPNYPRLKIGRPEAVDIKAMTEALKGLVPFGLRIEESVVRDRLGFPDPKAGATLLVAPAQNAPAGPLGAPTPVVAAPVASTRFLGFLNPLTAASAAGGDLPDRPDASSGDAIDRRVEADLDGWQALLEPMIAPIEAALGKAKSLEEAQGLLAGLIGEMDTTAFEQLLERSTFGARLAGLTGLNVV